MTVDPDLAEKLSTKYSGSICKQFFASEKVLISLWFFFSFHTNINS